MTNYSGLAELREWLVARGFSISPFRTSDLNQCNWYAYKRSAIPARECECNDGKPMQIVVNPYRIESMGAGPWDSAEVNVTGEAGGTWFALKAYSLKPDELMERFDRIEASLIAAWNALAPQKETST